MRALHAQLHVTRSTYPWLAAPDGPTRTDGRFADLRASLELRQPAEAIEAGTTFLATLTALLITLIGEGLSARILGAAWGDSGTTTHEAGK